MIGRDTTNPENGRAALRTKVEAVLSRAVPGIVLVTVTTKEGTVQTEIWKGETMGGLFLHAILNAVRSLMGLYEMGLREKPLEIKWKGGDHGKP